MNDNTNLKDKLRGANTPPSTQRGSPVCAASNCFTMISPYTLHRYKRVSNNVYISV